MKTIFTVTTSGLLQDVAFTNIKAIYNFLNKDFAGFTGNLISYKDNKRIELEFTYKNLLGVVAANQNLKKVVLARTDTDIVISELEIFTKW